MKGANAEGRAGPHSAVPGRMVKSHRSVTACGGALSVIIGMVYVLVCGSGALCRCHLFLYILRRSYI